MRIIENSAGVVALEYNMFIIMMKMMNIGVILTMALMGEYSFSFF